MTRSDEGYSYQEEQRMLLETNQANNTSGCMRQWASFLSLMAKTP
jgi:hypothetical protein